MRLRSIVAYALFLTLVAPLLDHHAVERLPWHGHLFAQMADARNAHLHLAQYPHIDSPQTESVPRDVVFLGDGSSQSVTSSAIGTPSLCAPSDAEAPGRPLLGHLEAGAMLLRDMAHPALPDPPPRLFSQHPA